MSQSGSYNNGVFPPGTVVQDLTGNVGGPVGPDGANNINVIGDGTSITVVGNPGTNTLTISAVSGGTVVETITGNTGGPVSPTAGNINIVTTNATPVFAGAGSTETLDFNLTNLVLGSSLPALAGGSSNVGVGQSILAAVTTGSGNAGVGYQALSSLTTGPFNTAVGYQALSSITTTGANSAFGASALNSCTGVQNTGIGYDALISLTSGGGNTALGYEAGINYTSTEANNIVIKNAGVLGESNTIHIGTQGGGAGQQNVCFIAGITGVNVGSVADVVSIATGTGQLGTTTITAGTGITIGTGANTITINAVGGGFSWVDVTAAAQAMAVNTGYTADRATLITFTLPAVAAYGSVMRIAYKGTGGYTIAQNAGQTIHFGATDSTTGGGGSVSSNTVGDCIELLCTTANTDFRVLSSVGNFTVV